MFGGIVLSEYFKGVCVCSATWRASLLGKVWVLFLYPCWCKNRSLHCWSSPRATGGRLRSTERGLWREDVGGYYSSLPHSDLCRGIWKSHCFPLRGSAELSEGLPRGRNANFCFFSTQASSPALILENLVKPNFLNQDSTSGDGEDCLTYADQVHFKSSFWRMISCGKGQPLCLCGPQSCTQPWSPLRSLTSSFALDILPPFTGSHILLLGEKLKPKPNFSINLDFFFFFFEARHEGM